MMDRTSALVGVVRGMGASELREFMGLATEVLNEKTGDKRYEFALIDTESPEQALTAAMRAVPMPDMPVGAEDKELVVPVGTHGYMMRVTGVWRNSEAKRFDVQGDWMKDGLSNRFLSDPPILVKVEGLWYHLVVSGGNAPEFSVMVLNKFKRTVGMRFEAGTKRYSFKSMGALVEYVRGTGAPQELRDLLLD